jgi:hypothetical protein
MIPFSPAHPENRDHLHQLVEQNNRGEIDHLRSRYRLLIRQCKNGQMPTTGRAAGDGVQRCILGIVPLRQY